MSDNNISVRLLHKLRDLLKDPTVTGAPLAEQMALKAIEDTIRSVQIGAKGIAVEEARFYLEEVKRQPLDHTDWENLQEIIYCDTSKGEAPSWYK